MTNRKNYNSIVFLTALSVYFGLALVGAPPVLAHAALTRNFDVQTEIEVKDDLDKKPDDEETGNFFELGLDEAVADFISDLRNLKRQGKYKSNFVETFTANCSHSYCSKDAGGASIVIEKPNGEIAEALWKLHDKIDVSDKNGFYKRLQTEFLKDSDAKSCKRIDLKLTFSRKELNVNVGFSNESTQKAFALAENLNRAFIVKSSAAKDALARKIYENTRAVSTNDQVFVITRLPRGSLNTLLKQSA